MTERDRKKWLAHHYKAGYREGLRQGKARERARLRRILDADGLASLQNELRRKVRSK